MTIPSLVGAGAGAIVWASVTANASTKITKTPTTTFVQKKRPAILSSEF